MKNAGSSTPFAFAIPENLKSAMSEKELEGIKELGSQISNYLSEQEKGLISQDKLNVEIKSLWDSHVKEWGMTKETFEQMQKTLKEQGLEIRTVVENSGKKTEMNKSFSEQIKEWVSGETFKSSIADKRSTSIELKAASPMSAYATSIGAFGPLTPAYPQAPELFRMEIDRTIHAAPITPTFAWNMFYKGSTDAAVIIWFNRKNPQGGAKFIPEYGLKPLMSWELARETANPYKIAVKVKVSMEMLEDASFIESEIRTVLNEDMQDKIDNALLVGTGTGTGTNEPEGITAWSSAYAGTGLDGTIENVNDADAIRAAVLQLRNLNYVPNLLVVSPTVKAQLDLTKDNNGNYLTQEIMALLSNLRIIESTRIPEGNFLLCDTRKFIVRSKGGLKMTTGWGVNEMKDTDEVKYASDFEINAVTIILEQQLFAYHNSIDEASSIYDSFATVKTALAKV